MEQNRGKILIWALAIAILGGSVWALYATGFFQAAGSPETLGEYIVRCAPWSHLAYFGIQLASVVIAPIPSNITAAAGAYLFGLWPSFLLTWGAVALGSAIVFILARVLGQKFAGQFVGEKLSERYLDVMLGEIRPKRVIIDPSAASMKAELRRRGYHTQDANNTVLEGISDVCSMLGADNLAFMPCCENTIAEFGAYLWDSKAVEAGVDAPLKESDHGLDATRYMVKTLRLVRRANTKEYRSIWD